MRKWILSIFIGLFSVPGHCTTPNVGDTMALQVDISSFSQKELNQFENMGRIDDADIFYRTYLLPNNTYFMTLKITPRDTVERDLILSNVGKGFEIIWVANFSEKSLPAPREEYGNVLPKIKPGPARSPKPDKEDKE